MEVVIHTDANVVVTETAAGNFGWYARTARPDVAEGDTLERAEAAPDVVEAETTERVAPPAAE